MPLSPPHLPHHPLLAKLRRVLNGNLVLPFFPVFRQHLVAQQSIELKPVIRCLWMEFFMKNSPGEAHKVAPRIPKRKRTFAFIIFCFAFLFLLFWIAVASGENLDIMRVVAFCNLTPRAIVFLNMQFRFDAHMPILAIYLVK